MENEKIHQKLTMLIEKIISEGIMTSSEQAEINDLGFGLKGNRDASTKIRELQEKVVSGQVKVQ